MQSKGILITGGNGYVGSRLAQHLLSRSDALVFLWLHTASPSDFATKRDALALRFGQYGDRVEYYGGDLKSEEPFSTVDPARVDMVVHSAAVTRFNVERDLAQEVNVEGSDKLFQFCERCDNLKRVAFISTVYSSGLRTGAIAETEFETDLGFANHYESSKWACEAMLLGRYGHLPWQIFRIATIVAEDDSGAVTQYNAVHNTLKLMYYGLLPLLPGKPDVPLYFVTAEFVAEAVYTLLCKASLNKIYHVAHTRTESLSLDDLIKTTFRSFSTDTEFSRRRVLPPLYTDQESFERLADSVQGFGGAVMKQSVASVKPFSQQLFLHKDVKNERLVADLNSYRAPDQKQLLQNICAHLTRTRWGREATTA